MPLQFVGINQPSEKTRENATLIFTARVKPDGPYSRELAIGFDIEEYASMRLDRERSGNGRLFSWYSHWKPKSDANGKPLHAIDDAEYVETDSTQYRNSEKSKKKFVYKESLGSVFRLSFLEQLGMRESDAYRTAIDNLPADKFTDEDKAELKKIAGSHGKSRGGTKTFAEKTDDVIATLREHGESIVASHLTPAEMADLADVIETESKAIATACRQPLETHNKVEAERRTLQQAIADADAEVAEKVKGNSIKQVREAYDAKEAAIAALAEFNAKHATPAEVDADATADADATDATDQTAEDGATADATAEDGAAAA